MTRLKNINLCPSGFYLWAYNTTTCQPSTAVLKENKVEKVEFTPTVFVYTVEKT